ncbi:hypothetical protein [Magnetospirillum sp. 64-120]|uniref:hypothetical protein n=1 Tax=Magnetospirillum sp. 64-120 TaxID=1895778 RepID=UPI0025B9BDA0|nr:hypothetical protein [Magnetospirillum sp. 64-120]
MKPVTHYDRNVVAFTSKEEAPEPVTVKELTPSARRHHQGVNPRQSSHRAGIGVEADAKAGHWLPEQRLWLNVIRLAMEDAVCPQHVTPHEAEVMRERARLWFQGNGKDFRDVCLMAGLDPDMVRETALKRIAQGSDSAAWGGSSARRRPGRPRKAKPARPQSAFGHSLAGTTALTPAFKAAGKGVRRGLRNAPGYPAPNCKRPTPGPPRH